MLLNNFHKRYFTVFPNITDYNSVTTILWKIEEEAFFDQQSKMRPPRTFWTLFLLIFITILSANVIWGTPLVPFHPDESTQLFMSKEFDLIFVSPLSMVWLPEKKGDLTQHYREIDAPITRYLIGIGRTIAGFTALPVDWEWNKSWEENNQRGALPDIKLLNVGRWSVVLLFPLCLLLIYKIGSRIGGSACGVIAALLLGVNALVLLHNRRAMAESALTFGILFAIWSFLLGQEKPWLAGIGMALAFNSKHSSLALLPVGLISTCWLTPFRFTRIKKIIWNGIQFIGIFILITFVLNPYLWKYPIKALEASWNSRNELMGKQLSDTIQLAPGQALLTPTQRIAAMVYNTYIALPAFSEANNYSEQTKASEEAYLATPSNRLMRNQIWGTVILILTLFGILTAMINIRHSPHEKSRELVILLLGTFSQAIFLLFYIPLPWQRYIIPLVPFVCLWVAFSITMLYKAFARSYRAKKRLT